MLRYLKLLLIIPLGIAIIGLAVLNRGAVKLVYWPQQLGGEFSLSLPLFVCLMLALMVGVVLGGMATWLAQGSHRRAERQYRKEAERLKAEADRLKALQPASGEMILPALRAR
ncbi:MAG: lipopolysaccharide assembly protein LapA domain-containing protein [Beijerinckiaceae bacterium]